MVRNGWVEVCEKHNDDRWAMRRLRYNHCAQCPDIFLLSDFLLHVSGG